MEIGDGNVDINQWGGGLQRGGFFGFSELYPFVLNSEGSDFFIFLLYMISSSVSQRGKKEEKEESRKVLFYSFLPIFLAGNPGTLKPSLSSTFLPLPPAPAPWPPT